MVRCPLGVTVAARMSLPGLQVTHRPLLGCFWCCCSKASACACHHDLGTFAALVPHARSTGSRSSLVSAPHLSSCAAGHACQPCSGPGAAKDAPAGGFDQDSLESAGAEALPAEVLRAGRRPIHFPALQRVPVDPAKVLSQPKTPCWRS